MPSNHLILCRPLLLLPSIFPSIRVFSNESARLTRWPKYWSFSFSISSTNEHPGLIAFRMDWLDLLLSTYYVPSIIVDRTVNKSLSLCLRIFRRGDNRMTNHNVIWETEKCYEKNKIWSWDRVTSKGRNGGISSPKVVRHCLTAEVVVSIVWNHKENTKAMVRPLTRHVTLHKSLKLVRSGLHDLQTAELEETYGASVSPESVFCHFLSLSWDPMPWVIVWKKKKKKVLELNYTPVISFFHSISGGFFSKSFSWHR